MDTVKDSTRLRTAKVGTKLKKLAKPGKPGEKSAVAVAIDESTRALIDAIKGLKGLR